MTSNYLQFEDKFRGDREKILETLSIYEPLIEIVIQDINSPKLIDVGCGRGEWLQKWKDRIEDCYGIDSNTNMIRECLANNLQVLKGDAIDQLSQFASGTITVITIFHVIEHLENKRLLRLIEECQRVLSDDGILIIETPSIDSLLVSTNSFHLDPTHINPINLDLISFHLGNSGFSNVKSYYIHGGPLQEASHLKITRILNGVAQDLCVIATKTKQTFKKIYSQSHIWESKLDIGITTLQAAIDHDLKSESLIGDYYRFKDNNQRILEQQSNEINFLKNELISLKSQLKISIYFFKVIKILLSPFIRILKKLRKFITILSNKIFNLSLRNPFVRNLVVSKIGMRLINLFLKYFLGYPSGINNKHIQNKFHKLFDRHSEFINYNQKLLLHYQQSIKSERYKNLFSKRK